MRLIRSRYSNHQPDEENPYWISFSDIMAGLLVIFMLAAVVFILELIQKSEQWDKEIEKLAKAEEARKDMLADIYSDLKKQGIHVEIVENFSVIRIGQETLSFDRASHRIPKDKRKREILRMLGNIIYANIQKNDRWKHLDTIFIEGHTDPDKYYNPEIYGNWGLSTLRAISLWLFWNKNMQEGMRLDELHNLDNRKLFSVSGYAETRPPRCASSSERVCQDGHSTDYEKYRRIDIRITVRRPELDTYQSIRELMR